MRLRFYGTNGGVAYKGATICMGIDDSLLLECGDNEFTKKSRKEQILAIEAVFITHLHSDHAGGLGNLLACMWLLGKEGLEVYGPSGDKIYGISDYLRSRFHDPRLPSLASKLDVRVVEVGEGSLDVKGYKLTTCWTDHNIPTLACKLRKGLRSIAYSSDVHQCKRVVELAKGVDLLVHECTFSDGQMELARKTLHSTPSLVATTVREAKPKRVVLTHFDRTSEPKVDEFASLVEDLTGIDTIAAYEGLELRI